MSKRVYEMGLVRRGQTLVLQLADDRDQLSCELIKYIGPRENTIKNLRSKQAQLSEALKRQGFKFRRFQIERIPGADYSAGHVSTLAAEVSELRVIGEYYAEDYTPEMIGAMAQIAGA
jgi:hypothetical protein